MISANIIKVCVCIKIIKIENWWNIGRIWSIFFIILSCLAFKSTISTKEDTIIIVSWRNKIGRYFYSKYAIIYVQISLQSGLTIAKYEDYAGIRAIMGRMLCNIVCVTKNKKTKREWLRYMFSHMYDISINLYTGHFLHIVFYFDFLDIY